MSRCPTCGGLPRISVSGGVALVFCGSCYEPGAPIGARPIGWCGASAESAREAAVSDWDILVADVLECGGAA